MSERRKLANISEAMKEWSALLGTEVAGWPGVRERKMFGMTAYFRKGTIFAALPRTKCFDTPQSFAIKLHRVTPATRTLLEGFGRSSPAMGDKWTAVEVRGPQDLGDAVKLLHHAYSAASSK
jgi:hypothetical protein